MDKAGAIFEAVGMLVTAYGLGYPIAWGADKAGQLFVKLGQKSRAWAEFNRLSDELYGSPMPQIKWPWKK